MTTRHPHHTGSTRLSLLLLVLVATAAALGAATLARPSAASAAATATSSYGWPVKPFFRQHPVRGVFGDPRILGSSHSFHFGVDVSCPNGTPVYATMTGIAHRHPLHRDVVEVISRDGHRAFGYWHITPLVADGARVVAYRTVVGRVEAPWEHVHFAEEIDGVYVNPLRSGALGPYVDHTAPTVRGFTVESAGHPLAGHRARGRVDLVVEAYDTTPMRIRGPWGGKPVTPALIEWRLVPAGGTRSTVSTTSWHTAVDVRWTYPSNALFGDTYAQWTRQNKKHRPARYRFALTHGLDTTTLSNGQWLVQVRATDTRGNSTTRAFGFLVANA